MYTMKLLVELTVITALSVQVVHANSELCTTACGKGEHCKDDDCLPCPPKSYQNRTRHRETFCKPWTSVTDYGWVIKRNGSATEDVQWKCGDQYKMVQYSPGSYECRYNVTASSASITNTTQPAENITISPIGPTQTRATTTNDKTIPPGDDLILLLSILIPILLMAIAAAIVIFLRWKNLYCFSKIQEPNREPSKNPLLNGNRQDELDARSIASELYNLFDKVINIIGLGSCESLLIGLNVSIIHNKPNKTKGDYIKDLSRWAKAKPDLNHARSIRASLDSIGFKLPPEPKPTQSTTVDIERQSEEDIERLRNEDIARLMRDLAKAELLNNAFERFCHGMVKDLGTIDGQDILGNLNLTKVMEFKDAEKKSYETAFCKTLQQWSYSHACIQLDNGNQWLPLDILKDTLRKIERNDIVDKMENSTHEKYNDGELKDIIKSYFNVTQEETAL